MRTTDSFRQYKWLSIPHWFYTFQKATEFENRFGRDHRPTELQKPIVLVRPQAKCSTMHDREFYFKLFTNEYFYIFFLAIFWCNR